MVHHIFTLFLLMHGQLVMCKSPIQLAITCQIGFGGHWLACLTLRVLANWFKTIHQLVQVAHVIWTIFKVGVQSIMGKVIKGAGKMTKQVETKNFSWI